MQRFNDTFHEEIIVRTNKGTANLLFAVQTIFMVLFALAAVVYLQGVLGMIVTEFNLMVLINFLIFAGMAVLLFFTRNNLRIDYEYSYTNGIIDIAMVKNNKIRKELVTLKAKEMEIMAPIMTNGFDKYQSMSDMKKVRAWLNRDRAKYFIIARIDGQKTMIVMEPSETFVNVCWKQNPSLVKKK